MQLDRPSGMTQLTVRTASPSSAARSVAQAIASNTSIWLRHGWYGGIERRYDLRRWWVLDLTGTVAGPWRSLPASPDAPLSAHRLDAEDRQHGGDQ